MNVDHVACVMFKTIQLAYTMENVQCTTHCSTFYIYNNRQPTTGEKHCVAKNGATTTCLLVNKLIGPTCRLNKSRKKFKDSY